MPSRDHTRRRHTKESQFHTIYNGDPGEPQIDRRTKQIGKPGYFECPQCGNWARRKRDGMLYAHLTGGWANVKCVYTGVPKGQVEQKRFFFTVTIQYEGSAVVPMEDVLKPYNARSNAIREAITAAMPESIPTSGATLSINITDSRIEVVSAEETA